MMLRLKIYPAMGAMIGRDAVVENASTVWMHIMLPATLHYDNYRTLVWKGAGATRRFSRASEWAIC